MRNKPIIAALISFIVVCLLAGCAGKSSSDSAAKAPTGESITVQDSAGRSVVLPTNPKRIVVLSTSFLELLYAIDGQAVGRPSSKTDAIPAAAQGVPEVGFVYNINMEKVLALQPDLVIAVQGMHENLIPTLESNHVPVLLLKYKTLDDTLNTIQLLGKIIGAQDKAAQIVQNIQGKIAAITAKMPQKQPPLKVAILHATSKSVTVELDRTIAGSVAQQLGLQNIASGVTAPDKNSDYVPYSLETLVAADPDILFVVTMGNSSEINKRLQADVESNPAWNTLRAVQNGKMYFLPSDLFLLNPGLKMPEAVEHMAKLINPEVYGRVQ